MGFPKAAPRDLPGALRLWPSRARPPRRPTLSGRSGRENWSRPAMMTLRQN